VNRRWRISRRGGYADANGQPGILLDLLRQLHAGRRDERGERAGEDVGEHGHAALYRYPKLAWGSGSYRDAGRMHSLSRVGNTRFG
jgi:hypothetical protein